jgi:HSP20 family molecular chaperone IbpA
MRKLPSQRRDSFSSKERKEKEEDKKLEQQSPLQQSDEARRRVEHLFTDICAESDLLRVRLNDLFFRVQTMIRNLTWSFPFDRTIPDGLSPIFSRKNPNQFDIVDFNSEVFRRFILSREEPLVETVIDDWRGELRILAIMPGVRKEDIELEIMNNRVTARSLAVGDKRSISATLPAPVKLKSIETSYANGVLEAKLKLKSPKKYYKVKIK